MTPAISDEELGAFASLVKRDENGQPVIVNKNFDWLDDELDELKPTLVQTVAHWVGPRVLMIWIDAALDGSTVYLVEQQTGISVGLSLVKENNEQDSVC